LIATKNFKGGKSEYTISNTGTPFSFSCIRYSVSTLGGSWCLAHAPIDTPFATAAGLYWFGAGASVIFTSSAVVLFILSFVALKIAYDGSYIIRKNSWYGKIFSTMTRLDNDLHPSFCKAFWRTNVAVTISVLVFGIILGLSLLFRGSATEIGSWETIMAILGFIGSALYKVFLIYAGLAVIVGIIWGIIYLIKTAWKKSGAADRYYLNTQTVGTIQFIGLLLLIVACIGFLIYGMTWIPSSVWPYITMVAGAIAAIVGLVIVWHKYIAKTRAGKYISSFYTTWMCPRLRVE